MAAKSEMTVLDSFTENEDFLSGERLEEIREGIKKAKEMEDSYSDMIIMYPVGLAGLAERLFREVMEYRKIVHSEFGPDWPDPPTSKENE